MTSKAFDTLDVVLMVTLITFWGSSFVVVKLVLGEGLSPIAIATFRFMLAGALFTLAIGFNRKRNPKSDILIRPHDFPMIMFLALSGVTLFFTVQYTGIQLAGASIAAILVCLLAPLLITGFSALILKETLALRQVLGMATAAFGTTVVVAATATFHGSQFFYGTMILLATPVLWAAYTLAGRKILDKYEPLLVVAYVNALGGLMLIPFSLGENSFHQIVALSFSEWLGIIYLAIACSFVGYYIWFYVLNRVGAIASSFLFAEPLVTAVFAAIFVDERLSPLTVIGGLLIFAGVFLVTWQGSRPHHRKTQESFEG
jgi:drug/metabolite transporter (DMT)-like permease